MFSGAQERPTLNVTANGFRRTAYAEFPRVTKAERRLALNLVDTTQPWVIRANQRP